MVAAAPIVYRRASNIDLPELCGLIWRVFGETVAADCTPEGRQTFLRSVSIAGVKRRMRGEAFLVAEASSSIVGVAAAIPNMLSLLFVHAAHRRRGIARGLIRESFQLYPGTPAREIYVGAALGAVAMYERLGFRAADPKVTNRDMPSVLMRLAWDGKQPF